MGVDDPKIIPTEVNYPYRRLIKSHRCLDYKSRISENDVNARVRNEGGDVTQSVLAKGMHVCILTYDRAYLGNLVREVGELLEIRSRAGHR
jgi:hypothetical protein